MEVVSGYFEHLIIYFSPNLLQQKPDVFFPLGLKEETDWQGKTRNTI